MKRAPPPREPGARELRLDAAAPPLPAASSVAASAAADAPPERAAPAPPLERAAPTPPPESRDRLESALHDVTNAISAARSFGDVLLLRSQGGAVDRSATLIDSLLREIDRASQILKGVRQETYRAGDTLTCRACGYTFVNRKATGKEPSCRRCRSTELARWRPSE